MKFFKISILILIFVSFGIQYCMIISYFKEVFEFTNTTVRNEALYIELNNFKIYLVENVVFLIFQSICIFLCLNIGFLFFKIKITFKNILNLIVFSYFSIVVFNILIICIVKFSNWTFLTDSINLASEKLSLSSYMNIEKIHPWMLLSFSYVNFKQLLIIILLAIGIRKFFNIQYLSSFSIVIKTYGFGLFLWIIFTMVMEMNFGLLSIDV